MTITAILFRDEHIDYVGFVTITNCHFVHFLMEKSARLSRADSFLFFSCGIKICRCRFSNPRVLISTTLVVPVSDPTVIKVRTGTVYMF